MIYFVIRPFLLRNDLLIKLHHIIIKLLYTILGYRNTEYKLRQSALYLKYDMTEESNKNVQILQKSLYLTSEDVICVSTKECMRLRNRSVKQRLVSQRTTELNSKHWEYHSTASNQDFKRNHRPKNHTCSYSIKRNVGICKIVNLNKIIT